MSCKVCDGRRILAHGDKRGWNPMVPAGFTIGKKSRVNEMEKQPLIKKYMFIQGVIGCYLKGECMFTSRYHLIPLLSFDFRVNACMGK